MSDDRIDAGVLGSVDPADMDDGETQRRGLDRLRPDDRIHQQYQERPIPFGINPEDGMPQPAVVKDPGLAPPLAIETLVCLEDRTKFVIRDKWGDIIVAFDPDQVQRSPVGLFRVTVMAFRERLGEEKWKAWRENYTSEAGDHLVIRNHIDDRYMVSDGFVQVLPVRPQCKHLLRQLSDIQGNTEKVMMERCCTARRDDGGEFMSLVDVQMPACEFREPHDSTSHELLERSDALRLKIGRERRLEGAGVNLNEIGVDPLADLEGIVE